MSDDFQAFARGALLAQRQALEAIANIHDHPDEETRKWVRLASAYVDDVNNNALEYIPDFAAACKSEGWNRA